MRACLTLGPEPSFSALFSARRAARRNFLRKSSGDMAPTFICFIRTSVRTSAVVVPTEAMAATVAAVPGPSRSISGSLKGMLHGWCEQPHGSARGACGEAAPRNPLLN